MPDNAFFRTHDHEGEATGFSVNIAEVTGDVTALQTAIATLRTATTAIMQAGGIETTGYTDTTYNTPVVVADPFAQREIKWQVVVVDASGNKYRSTEVPMAKLGLLPSGSKYIIKGGVIVGDDTGSVITNWKNAYEALAVSPSGEAVQVWDMMQVGRNI